MSIYLQLTAAGRYFSLSPLAAHLYTACTAPGPCGERASHRSYSVGVAPQADSPDETLLRLVRKA